MVGVVSVICALAYTGGPFPLAYNALGDVFVVLFFGVVAGGGDSFGTLQLGGSHLGI
jgi:1,4-dihydroxy-2-naphthoate octaprenyltransferase